MQARIVGDPFARRGIQSPKQSLCEVPRSFPGHYQLLSHVHRSGLSADTDVNFVFVVDDETSVNILIKTNIF